MIKRVAAALQVSGVSLLAVAAWTVNETFGLAVAGLGVLAFGVALERD